MHHLQYNFAYKKIFNIETCHSSQAQLIKLTSALSIPNLKLRKHITRSRKIPETYQQKATVQSIIIMPKLLCPNSIKKNFVLPHLAAEARTSWNHPTRSGWHTPRRIPFFFPPHPYPYLCFLYPKLFLYTRLSPSRIIRVQFRRASTPIPFWCKEKNLFIKM